MSWITAYKTSQAVWHKYPPVPKELTNIHPFIHPPTAPARIYMEMCFAGNGKKNGLLYLSWWTPKVYCRELYERESATYGWWPRQPLWDATERAY